MEIHSIEFTCASDADFDRRLRRAVEENSIPVAGIISVAKRDTAEPGSKTESWVIVWRAKKASEFH